MQFSFAIFKHFCQCCGGITVTIEIRFRFFTVVLPSALNAFKILLGYVETSFCGVSVTAFEIMKKSWRIDFVSNLLTNQITVSDFHEKNLQTRRYVKNCQIKQVKPHQINGSSVKFQKPMRKGGKICFTSSLLSTKMFVKLHCTKRAHFSRESIF